MAGTVRIVLVAAIVLVLGGRTDAHPMPNTVITVVATDGGARLRIAMPVSDLRLALPPRVAGIAHLDAESCRQDVRAYFDAHLAVLSASGDTQAHAIESIAVRRATDVDVGAYEELEMSVWVPATAAFDPTHFRLHYDAIIHQVPNHIAVIQSTNADDPAMRLGAIAFDFIRNTTESFDVRLGKRSVFEHRYDGMTWLLFAIAMVAAHCFVRYRSLAIV